MYTHTYYTQNAADFSRADEKKIRGTRTNISGIREQRRKRKVSYLRRLKGEGVSQFTTSHISRAHFQRQSPPRAKLRTYNATVSQNSTHGAFFFFSPHGKNQGLFIYVRRRTKNILDSVAPPPPPPLSFFKGPLEKTSSYLSCGDGLVVFIQHAAIMHTRGRRSDKKKPFCRLPL